MPLERMGFCNEDLKQRDRLLAYRTDEQLNRQPKDSWTTNNQLFPT
jgi:hypothetical protein